MKKVYISPMATTVRLNVSGEITEDTVPIGSQNVDSSEIEGKETDFEEDGNVWGSYENDFTRNWMFGNIRTNQWDK